MRATCLFALARCSLFSMEKVHVSFLEKEEKKAALQLANKGKQRYIPPSVHLSDR
eukprot:jgi/Mesvir1/157/Mv25417-RA.1